MKGFLIVSHGSRAPEAKLSLERLAERVRQRIPESVVELCYMQFDVQTIEKGLDALIKKGARHITVIPYFLFEGIHIREDIPEVLNQYAQAHQGVTIALDSVLGDDPRICDILADRIRRRM